MNNERAVKFEVRRVNLWHVVKFDFVFVVLRLKDKVICSFVCIYSFWFN